MLIRFIATDPERGLVQEDHTIKINGDSGSPLFLHMEERVKSGRILEVSYSGDIMLARHVVTYLTTGQMPQPAVMAGKHKHHLAAMFALMGMSERACYIYQACHSR